MRYLGNMLKLFEPTYWPIGLMFDIAIAAFGHAPIETRDIYSEIIKAL